MSSSRNRRAAGLLRPSASQTSFLNGKGKNKFVASFDWLLKEKNFVNVYEGKFFC